QQDNARASSRSPSDPDRSRPPEERYRDPPPRHRARFDQSPASSYTEFSSSTPPPPLQQQPEGRGGGGGGPDPRRPPGSHAADLKAWYAGRGPSPFATASQGGRRRSSRLSGSEAEFSGAGEQGRPQMARFGPGEGQQGEGHGRQGQQQQQGPPGRGGGGRPVSGVDGRRYVDPFRRD
ncbi:hypothetical protein LTR91_018636, partial [Friedmanniomyces endolithicus]